jgi:RimJ/RimL family protein N-acetyltransferase
MGGVKVFLETERLVLRQFTRDDLDLIIELDGDPDVMHYINNGQPVDLDEVTENLEWWLGYYERFEGYGFWAAIERATGEFLGWFHFRPHEGAGPLQPELGYRLRRQAWGKGYATEASRALIDKGFIDHGVERVNAETMAVNTGSRRVMEKAGLRFVRTFDAEWPVRIPGDEEGDVEYAITRAEWEADRAARRA